MKNKLLTLIMMFLLVGPSIAFSMEATDLNDIDLQDSDYLEEMDIEYPTEESESMYPEYEEIEEEEEEGDQED